MNASKYFLKLVHNIIKEGYTKESKIVRKYLIVYVLNKNQ